MKTFKERYEFAYEEVSIQGVNGIAFDVVPEGCKEMGINRPCVHIMTGDAGDDNKGNELGHKILGSIEFRDISNLELFQIGLELIQKAMFDEAELDDA